jgi:hypothetical protein
MIMEDIGALKVAVLFLHLLFVKQVRVTGNGVFENTL